MSAAVLEQQIRDVAACIGIALPQGAADRLAAYTEEIIRWNRHINLTGAKDPKEFVDGPLFDAMTLIPVLSKTMGSFADIGSGGGLPGIPAAIAASIPNVTLVEPRSRRASFLRHAVHFLSLDIQVVESRDDDLDTRWSGAAAQAVFEPAEWLKRAGRLIHPGGFIYVLSAEQIDKSMLPSGATIDAEFHCIRPLKQMQRFAIRVVI